MYLWPHCSMGSRKAAEKAHRAHCVAVGNVNCLDCFVVSCVVVQKGGGGGGGQEVMTRGGNKTGNKTTWGGFITLHQYSLNAW